MTTEDLIHLEWIHNRLIDVYGESRNTDFVTRLRTIINEAEVVNKNAVLPRVSNPVICPNCGCNKMDLYNEWYTCLNRECDFGGKL